MNRFLILVMMMVAPLALAQSNTELFEQGKEHYSKDAFQEAIAVWEQILENGQHSKELYFNLGNAYYKTDQAGPSIYYYEKALQLDPNDKEVKNNLAFAQNMRIDIIEPLPKTVFAKWYAKLSNFLSTTSWAISSIVFILLLVAAFLSYYFSGHTRKKRLLFAGSLVFLGLCLLSFAMAYLTYSDAQNSRSAIVFDPVLEVKDAPTPSGEVSFELHPGTKVAIDAQDNEWFKIKLVDGKEGWAKASGLKEL